MVYFRYERSIGKGEKMKKTIVFSGMLVLSFVVFFGQTIDELLSLVNNISNIDYAQSLSTVSGISGWSVDLGGSLLLPTSLAGTATTKIEVSKSLKIGVNLSNEKIRLFATFDPFAYQRASNNILYEHINKKIKLKIKIIDLFFDAYRNARTISQLSSEATSLKNETETYLLKSRYTYDVQMINTLLGIQISNLKFPTLEIPKIPENYTPITFPKPQIEDSDFSINGSMDFSNSSKQLEFKVSLNYDWSPKIKKESRNLLDIEKRRYFRDIHILSKSVKAYDNELSKLFKLYSKVYSDYLAGKRTIDEVKNVSNQISSLGYERDMYCIKLIEEFYLYRAIGD